MASLIENYGLIGDLHGSALVSRDGSMDWLCIPRFDSEACMAALLGRDEHGHWLHHPGAAVRRTNRRYRPGTMILETDYECDGGSVRLVDFMPFGPHRRVVRIVEGLEGTVPLHVKLVVRFGYGCNRPWVTRVGGAIQLMTAPDALVLRTPARLEFDEQDVWGLVTVGKGERVPFELSWYPADAPPPPGLDVRTALAETERAWTEWSGRSTYRGPYQDAVNRSLVPRTWKLFTPRPDDSRVAVGA